MDFKLEKIFRSEEKLIYRVDTGGIVLGGNVDHVYISISEDGSVQLAEFWAAEIESLPDELREQVRIILGLEEGTISFEERDFKETVSTERAQTEEIELREDEGEILSPDSSDSKDNL